MLETFRRFVDWWDSRFQGRSKPAPSSATAEKISVLAITPDDGDRRLLSVFSIRGQWDLAFASAYPEAVDILKGGRAAVIICDRDLPGLDWRKCLEDLAASSPGCPIILTSSVYDEYLWEEVVHRGGYDVLGKPLQEDQAVRAVNLAWSYSMNVPHRDKVNQR
jgi:DNA-binding NtrC family response regulator